MGGAQKKGGGKRERRRKMKKEEEPGSLFLILVPAPADAIASWRYLSLDHKDTGLRA